MAGKELKLDLLNHHDNHAVVSCLKLIYDFVSQEYTDFLTVLWTEIIQEIHMDKAGNSKDQYIRKYCATGLCGDNSLLQYRRYKKESYQERTLLLQFQTMMDEK